MIAFFEKLSLCLVGMEACATAHHWARELAKLGHAVKLIPAGNVKAYVRRQKNDAADAAAICEAVSRPSMRLVPLKTVELQAALMLHRARDPLILQRTQLINALRAHHAELGLVAEKGREGIVELAVIASDESNGQALPSATKQALQGLLDQLAALQQKIGTLERNIHGQHRASDVSRRLETIPGIGVIGATAIASTIADPNAFKTGRDFAAWVGLVPRQYSTVGKEKLGGISKQGDRYLRRLLVLGATAVFQHARRHPDRHPWVMKLLAKKPAKKVAVALANKVARIASSLLARGGTYRAPALAIEPPRVCRRLQLLRDWSHDESQDKREVFLRGA